MQQQSNEPSVVERFRPELRPGEQLLWTGRPGRPDRSQNVMRAAGPFAPFAVFIAIFALVAVTQARHSGQSMVNLAPFALILGLMLWTFLRPMRRARNTSQHLFYAVTGKRVLLLVTANERTLHAVELSDIPAIEKRERPDGSGSIIFTGIPSVVPTSPSTDATTALFLAFNDIPNVDDVYRIIEDHRNT